MSRRILITGATGGLGLELVAATRALGHDVLATGRSEAASARIQSTGAAFVAADLTTDDLRALCRGRESVIHAAALSAPWGPRKAFDRINLDATVDLLAAAEAEGCRRFVFVSSPSIFAGFRDRLGIRAGDAPTEPPLNHYARTKLAAERRVLNAHSADMATTVVRPRAIVGPDDHVILPRLAASVRRPRAPLIRGGRALIELTDVRDAAEAILCAEGRIDRVGGRAVNVSGGRAVAVRDVAVALAAALEAAPKMIGVPLPIARAAAVLSEVAARGDGAEPRLTRYTLATLAYSQTFDMEETARLLGFRPRHDALATLLRVARTLPR